MAETILTALSTVGFPIVMCLLLAYYIQQMQSMHTQETKELTEAINKNTIALHILAEKLGVKIDE